MEPSGGRRVVANPATDELFAAAVERLEGAADSPEELEYALQAEFPRVRVGESVTGDGERWYAYREGSWVSPFTRRE